MSGSSNIPFAPQQEINLRPEWWAQTEIDTATERLDAWQKAEVERQQGAYLAELKDILADNKPRFEEVERQWKQAQQQSQGTASGPPSVSSSLMPSYNGLGAGGDIQSIICSVFGSYCAQALAVVSCESGFDVNAQNGQYLGLFQMGANERATYGHGPDALTQSQAAYAYFAATNYTWGPWECKP